MSTSNTNKPGPDDAELHADLDAEIAANADSSIDEEALEELSDELKQAAEQAADAGEADIGDADDPLGFGAARVPQGEDDDSAAVDDPLAELQAALEQERARADENWDRLLRLQAEMENQRKRALNDVGKARKFALEGMVNDLLPIKDSLEMGLAASEQDGANLDSIREGVELTLKQFGSVFEKHNIEEINPLDEKFNPDFHQAMSMQEIEGKPANTVAAVMQKGYTLNERLVRPALVMVAK